MIYTISIRFLYLLRENPMSSPKSRKDSATSSSNMGNAEVADPEVLVPVQQFSALDEDYAIVKIDAESFIKMYGEVDVEAYLQDRVPSVPMTTILRLLPAVAALAAGMDPVTAPSREPT